jgi:leader peptidase (prepilin peptidase)/N-methyltransferase
MHEALDTLGYLFGTWPWLWVGFVFVFSLLVGSFLNVVIHRLPIMLQRDWETQAAEILREAEERAAGARRAASSEERADAVPLDAGPSLSTLLPRAADPAPVYNLVVPRSACVNCGTMIKAWQNIPVVSYLWLGGKCATCGVRISARYPAVEMLTAILCAAVAWKFGFTWYTAAALLMTWSLVALSGIDIDHQLLPDDITLPLLWVGLLLSLAGPVASIGLPVDPPSSILGAALGYLSLWSVYRLFKLLTGKEGMGYGDFKLLAALGAWLGWQMLLPIILLSASTGAVVGIVSIVARGRDRNIPIPFGPYLAGGGWIALMWGQDLIGSYLRFNGL